MNKHFKSMNVIVLPLLKLLCFQNHVFCITRLGRKAHNEMQMIEKIRESKLTTQGHANGHASSLMIDQQCKYHDTQWKLSSYLRGF